MSLVLRHAMRYQLRHPRLDTKGRPLCPHGKLKQSRCGCLGRCKICTPQTEETKRIGRTDNYNIKRVQKSHTKLKYQVFSHYCKEVLHCQCSGCKTTYIGFLQLDHIKDNGREHVDNKGKRLIGPNLWRWVRNNGYPEGFQVLCINCNSLGGKGVQDRCPMEGQPH